MCVWWCGVCVCVFDFYVWLVCVWFLCFPPVIFLVKVSKCVKSFEKFKNCKKLFNTLTSISTHITMKIIILVALINSRGRVCESFKKF